MSKRMMAIDLNTIYEVYASTLGLITRNRIESRKVSKSLNTFSLNLPGSGEKEEIEVIFKDHEINMKFVDNAITLASKSSDTADLSDIYAYFGEILGLFAFYSNFNTRDYPDLLDKKLEIKTALKGLTRAILKAESHGAYFANFNDQDLSDDDKKDGVFTNELRIHHNFGEEIEKMFDYLQISGNIIPTPRILSMTYLSMYYVLVGILPRIVKTNNMSMRQFLEVCATKNGANEYINAILTDNENNQKNRILGLMITFNALTSFYFVNCPVFKIKNDELSNKNLTLKALTNLGEAIKNLKDSELFGNNYDLLLELLTNNAFGSDIGIEDVINPYNYLMPVNRKTLINDYTSIAILGYDLNTLIEHDFEALFDLEGKRKMYFNSMYLNITKYDKEDLIVKIHLKEIEDYILYDLASDNNVILNPETIDRLLYFAGIARYKIATQEDELSEDDLDLLYSIIIHAETITIKLYNEWFVRKDRVFESVKRLYEIDSENITNLHRMLRKETDFIILNYCSYVKSLYMVTDETGDHDTHWDIISRIRSALRDIYINNLNKVTTFKSSRYQGFTVTTLELPENDKSGQFYNEEAEIGGYINNESSCLINLFKSDKTSDEYLGTGKLFEDMVNNNGIPDSYVAIKHFLEGLSITRTGIIDIPLYNVVVSNIRRILKSNLLNKEKFMILWVFIGYFVNKKFDQATMSGSNIDKVILIPTNNSDDSDIDNMGDKAVENFVRKLIDYKADNNSEKRSFYGELLSKIK